MRFLIILLITPIIANCAICQLKDGRRGNVHVLDTADVYDSTESSFRVRTEGTVQRLQKARIDHLILCLDTIYYRGDKATYADGTPIGKFSGDTIEAEESKVVEKTSYEDKFITYKKLRTGGIVLTAGGVATILVGIAMVSSADAPYYHVEIYSDGTRVEEGDPVGGWGSVIAICGVSYTVGGIVMTTIGTKKKNEYEEKMKNGPSVELDLGINSIKLSLKF